MGNEILYDFKAALAKIIESHSDMKLVISKWREMLDSTPRDVEFVFADGSKVVVPNIEKIVETINERTLPPDAVFDSVTASSPGGEGKLTGGGLSFAGGLQETTYNVHGIQSIPAVINDGDRWTMWPLPRYMRVESDENPTLMIAPSLNDRDIMHMSDFFVFVQAGASVTFIFSNYGQSQRMTLAASGNTMWQVCVTALNVSRAGLYTSARAVKLNIANGSEA
jgi:hypothetical protein